MIVSILLIIALICFIAAAANYSPGIGMGWLGAAFATLALLVPGIHA